MKVNSSKSKSLIANVKLDSIGMMKIKNAYRNARSVSTLMVMNVHSVVTTALPASKRQDNVYNAMI